MNKSVKTKDLYDCQVPYLKELFETSEYPWEMLPKIKDLIASLLETGIDATAETQLLRDKNADVLDWMKNSLFDIVFVKGQYTDFWTYLVNHSKKSVSPIHGYAGHGREYAKKIGYKYNNLYKE